MEDLAMYIGADVKLDGLPNITLLLALTRWTATIARAVQNESD
jgi:hypothetical protein